MNLGRPIGEVVYPSQEYSPSKPRLSAGAGGTSQNVVVSQERIRRKKENLCFILTLKLFTWQGPTQDNLKQNKHFTPLAVWAVSWIGLLNNN